MEDLNRIKWIAANRGNYLYIEDAGLEIMIASEKDSGTRWALEQLLMIRRRRCDHEWEDAVTMSAEGISMRGFRVCFRCDKIKVAR